MKAMTCIRPLHSGQARQHDRGRERRRLRLHLLRLDRVGPEQPRRVRRDVPTQLLRRVLPIEPRLPLGGDLDATRAPERAVLAALDASLVLGIRALKAAHPMLEDPDEAPDGHEPVLLIGESILATARSLHELIAGYGDLVERLIRVDGGTARTSRGSDPDDDATGLHKSRLRNFPISDPDLQVGSPTPTPPHLHPPNVQHLPAKDRSDAI